MILSDTGESRVRGYLYVLERSLRASGPAQLAADAVREVESHIRERVDESPGTPDEREALEAILGRLGSPARVAQAYSLERVLDEAATGGGFVAVIRSLFHAAPTGVAWFFTTMLLFMGYSVGVGFIATAVLKPIFPDNVGLWVRDDGISLGAQFPAPADVNPLGGYWIVPVCLLAGLLVLVLIHRLARRLVGALRERVRAEQIG